MTKKAFHENALDHHAVSSETVTIERPSGVCPMCEDYAKNHSSKPIAVMSCEGACLRGEIARRAANIICHNFESEKSVRICLGGAFTKDTGQRNLVRNAKMVIALEGCFLTCSLRMMKAVIKNLDAKVVIADNLYEFDKSLFSFDEMSEAEIKKHSKAVALKVIEKYYN